MEATFQVQSLAHHLLDCHVGDMDRNEYPVVNTLIGVAEIAQESSANIQSPVKRAAWVGSE